MNQGCPICYPMSSSTSRCENEHNGICIHIDDAMKSHVEQIYRYRAGHGLFNTTQDYNGLPFNMRNQDFVWRIRCEDAVMTLKLLRQHQVTSVLEIGSSNGWLSHLIAQAGYDLWAADYSIDKDQGLGAMQHYNVGWNRVQMDLTAIDKLNKSFDAMIINHGLHYLPDPVDYAKKCIQHLAPGAILIMLNLMSFRDGWKRAAQVARHNAHFQATTGRAYYLKPTRAYLDFHDRDALLGLGFQLNPYRCMWRANLKARFIPTAPRYEYAVLLKI